MAERGSLIPKEASDLLAAQDAARSVEYTRIEAIGVKRAAQQWRDNFVGAIAYELNLAHKWGASADVINGEYGIEISKSIRAKYPPRALKGWRQWLQQFNTTAGVPLFQFPPAEGLKGFIFNEGGRGVTLTITGMVPFRLYVAGFVLSKYEIDGWRITRFPKGPRHRD